MSWVGVWVGGMSIAASVGTGMAANAQREKERKEAGPAKMNLIFPEQPSYGQTRDKLSSDFVTQNLERIQQGKYPSWYEGISPLLREQQMKGLNEAYYGDRLSPGILDTSRSEAVSRGLPSGAAGGRTYDVQLQKYAEGSKAIDDYISQLGYTAQQQGSEFFPQMANQQSAQERSWATPISQYMSGGYTPQQNNWDSASSAFGQVGAMAPWIGGMANAGAAVNPNQQTQDLQQLGQFSYANDVPWSTGGGYGDPYNLSGTQFTGGNFAGGGATPVNRPWVQPAMQIASSIPGGLSSLPSYGFGQDIARNIPRWLSNAVYE